MPNVQMPDGSVVAFPDGMTSDAITQAIQSDPTFAQMRTPRAAGTVTPVQVSGVPQQNNGPMRWPAMLGQSALTGLTRGITAPGDIASAIGKALPAAIAPYFNAYAFGGPAPAVAPGDQVVNELTKAGLANTPSLTPGLGAYPKTERVASAGVSGLASALPMAAIGPASVALRAGLGGGLAADEANELLPGNKTAAVAAGLLGGLTGGVTAAGPTAERLAATLGSSRTAEEGGQALQDAARNWMTTTMPAKIDAVRAPLDLAMAANPPMFLDNFHGALDELNSSAGTLQKAADRITPSIARDFKKDLTLPANEEDVVAGNSDPRYMGLDTPTNWQDAGTLRTRLGDMIANPGMNKDATPAMVDKLYSAITKDMSKAAGESGASAAFDQFNNESTRLYRLAGGPMSKVIKDPVEANDPLATQSGAVATRLLNGLRTGGGDLGAIRGELPDAVDELAASAIRSDPKRWARLSPEGKTALVNDPDKITALDTLLPKSPGPNEGIENRLTAGIGGSLGSEVGTIGARLLGGGTTGELAGGALGGMTGTIAPWLLRRIGGGVLSPTAPLRAGVGANAANVLFPGTGQ